MASCRLVDDFGNELHVVRELSIAAHAQCITRYCDALPEEMRELFQDHCIMPEV